jgi:outer membrane protein OmpA-like peptidoglycan-associated protein
MQRIALILLFLVVTGVAAIFAAGHLGINLPWTVAVTEHDTPSQDREKSAAEAIEPSPQAALEETAKALGGASTEPPKSGKVEIDVSRIAPDGTSVFAGRSEPDSYVTVLENGKPAGTAKTDENGEWTLSTGHKFASTDPDLTYEVSRTPPPEPEKPPQQVAKAEPTPSPTQKSAASVAGEVMRKFENLVEQAREEAKQKAEETNSTEAAPEAPKDSKPPEQTTATVVEPGKPEPAPGSEADVGASAPTSPPAEPEHTSKTAEATVTVAPDPPSESAGVKTDIIPVPIMFVYNEATLTPDGERAAALLLEYLTLKHLNAVELTGHADERGTNEYNYDLSRERLETVANLLKQGGYTGELKLTPKGKTEPYMGVDRSAYSGEALYQLDRRVELRVTR